MAARKDGTKDWEKEYTTLSVWDDWDVDVDWNDDFDLMITCS